MCGIKYHRRKFPHNRKRAHIRSAEIEAVLAAAGEMAEGPGSVFTMIDNADLKLPTIKDEEGEEVELTKGNYQLFIRSTNRQVRKDVFEGLHRTFLKQRNTIASTLAAQVKLKGLRRNQRGPKKPPQQRPVVSYFRCIAGKLSHSFKRQRKK